MPSEPDNLVLVQLREIRATLAEHTGQFAKISERFAQIDKRFDEMRLLLGHTIGLSTTAYLRTQEFDRRYEFSEGAQRGLSERVADLERRLTKVEEKTED